MASNFQTQVQMLDSILYKVRIYRDPAKIRNDVMELLKNVPSLQPRSGQLSPTGPQLLCLYGTVPIFYNNSQYNIPVTIWVVDQYPMLPPTVFVSPTPDMIIKPRHQHVDSTGMTYLPYLSSWNISYNLVGLAEVLSKVFSQDPPVRAQGPPKSQPQPSPQPSPLPSPQLQQPSPQIQQVQNTSQYPPKTSDPETVIKKNAIIKLTEKLQTNLHSFHINCTSEIDDLIAKNSEIEGKIAVLQQQKKQIEQEKIILGTGIDEMTKRFEEINKWLESNENISQIDIDAVTEPKDPLSRQLLYLVAEDATIEDSLYYLEKALVNGDLSCEAWIKNVRSLSTEQFIKRATIKRIHEKQRGQ